MGLSCCAATPHLRPPGPAAAQAFQDIARQLSRLTEKQLVRLTPLLGEEVTDAVALAARISHRNQGRGRQEGLVARLLRSSADDGLGMDQLLVRRPFIGNSLLPGRGHAEHRQLGAWPAPSSHLLPPLPPPTPAGRH